MLRCLSVILLLAATGAHSDDLPPGAEMFRYISTDDGLSVETDEVAFAVHRTETPMSLRVTAILKKSGQQTEFVWDAGGPITPDRLFIEESHICNRRFFDLILRVPPTRLGDIARYNYSRIIFAEDLTQVTSYFDSTVDVANAVLPLQVFTEEGRFADHPGFAVTCEDGLPVIPDLF